MPLHRTLTYFANYRFAFRADTLMFLGVLPAVVHLSGVEEQQKRARQQQKRLLEHKERRLQSDLLAPTPSPCMEPKPNFANTYAFTSKGRAKPVRAGSGRSSSTRSAAQKSSSPRFVNGSREVAQRSQTKSWAGF